LFVGEATLDDMVSLDSIESVDSSRTEKYTDSESLPKGCVLTVLDDLLLRPSKSGESLEDSRGKALIVFFCFRKYKNKL